MSRLRDAAEAYVRAEYYFRLGPDAYSRAAQTSLIKAEEELLKAVAGERYLRPAAAALGIQVEEDLKPRKSFSVLQPAKAAKPRVRLVEPTKARKGLLD